MLLPVTFYSLILEKGVYYNRKWTVGICFDRYVKKQKEMNMNNIDPKLSKLIKSIVKTMHLNFEFQISLFKLVIDGHPNLTPSQKDKLRKTAESLELAHKLLHRQSDELLPS